MKQDDRTHAVIIGASKCGTTTLFSHLAGHPDVVPCREKEPNFFSSDENWARGADWYGSLFPWKDGGYVGLEATTLYTWAPMLPAAPARMRETGLPLRFLYILRDPIERIESHLTYDASKGYDSLPESGPLPDWILNVSRFAFQADAYAELFGKESLLLVTLENLRSDPAAVLRRACRHLGIDHGYSFPDPERAENVTQGRHRDHPLWSALRRVGPLRAFVRLLPLSLRSGVRGAVGSEWQRKIELDDARREDARSRLAPDMAQLAERYGVDVAPWGFG